MRKFERACMFGCVLLQGIAYLSAIAMGLSLPGEAPGARSQLAGGIVWMLIGAALISLFQFPLLLRHTLARHERYVGMVFAISAPVLLFITLIVFTARA